MLGRPNVADAVDPWATAPGPPRGVRLAGRIVLGLLVPTLVLARPLAGDATGPGVATIAISVVVGIALSLGYRWPEAALAVSLAGFVVAQALEPVNAVLAVACELALFNLALRRPRRICVPAGVITALVLLIVVWADTTGPITEPRTVIVAVWTALALAFGDGVRMQRAYVNALGERARRAEESGEQEARARVAEERVRIARELHDVVAHHIAVINVHAGLARRAQGRDAVVVDTSLGHVQDAARTVLDELGTVLRVLRSDDVAGPGTDPLPGLAQLDDLIATFGAAGLVVGVSATGRPREMDRACDLAVYRIIQESLTNASKHGAGGHADLSLTYGADAVTIAVINLARAEPAGSAGSASPPGGPARRVGQGLVGMRERVAGAGGSLTARLDPGGAFRLVAVVPYRPRGADEAGR
ncbi:sensor histidine kinase [Pengzhenrongella sicca]|uniref:histidine kinase n=1 Tax=Pengzhenrongella sicca TaxID=2819238 RepID=A0A8A4ZBA6_9MICO|nr:histidine kinase [Pengzhenrongella sicca]QTE28299.1 two-component sensor histidine kinase [Pengzhenrongella sicca]